MNSDFGFYLWLLLLWLLLLFIKYSDIKRAGEVLGNNQFQTEHELLCYSDKILFFQYLFVCLWNSTVLRLALSA